MNGVTVTMIDPAKLVMAPRCERCNKKLANYLTLPFNITCLRCRHENERK